MKHAIGSILAVAIALYFLQWWHQRHPVACYDNDSYVLGLRRWL